MAMQVQVGVPAAQVDGTQANPLAGRFADQLLSEFMPRYYNIASRGFVMQAHNTAALAITAGLPALAYTGLCVSNPVGNNKKFVLLMGQFCETVATAGADLACIGIITGFDFVTNVTHTLALTTGPSNMLLGLGAAPTAKADSQATVTGSPAWSIMTRSAFTATALPTTTPNVIDFGGCLVLQPGCWMAWGSLLGLSGLGSFIWAELPL